MKTCRGAIPARRPAPTSSKALGRALAALGFGTQFCEDFDFAQGHEGKVVDAPVDIRGTRAAASRPQAGRASAASVEGSGSAAAVPAAATAPQQGGSGWQERPATEPQVKAIYAIARGAQAMDDGTLEEWCRTRYGVLPAELTRRQASEVIDALKLGAAS